MRVLKVGAVLSGMVTGAYAHSCSDKRIELTEAVLQGLDYIVKPVK